MPDVEARVNVVDRNNSGAHRRWLCDAQVEQELTELGLSKEAMDGIVAATRIGDLKELQELLGDDNEASQELQELFSLAEGYGIAEYLQLDTSCVRGLAYYTGKSGAETFPDHHPCLCC